MNPWSFQPDTQRVIYAYNDIAPPNPNGELPYHTSRGVKSILLTDNQPPIDKLEEEQGVEFWDILAPNVSLFVEFASWRCITGKNIDWILDSKKRDRVYNLCDFLFSQVSLPESFTSLYWCSMHRLKNLTEKHHMIGVSYK